MCKKQITLRKFLKLLLEVEFYNDASQLKHNLINLDKVYFLRQYLKSFEIGNNTLEKAKQFTKVAN